MAALGSVLLAAPPSAMAEQAPLAHASAPAMYPRIPIWSPSYQRGLAYDAYIYRAIHNVPAGRNVAVFRYRLPNGEERTLAIDSAPCTGNKCLIEGHSERRLGEILQRWGVDPSWVIDIYSELEPCTMPGSFCRKYIDDTFKNLESLSWSYDYPYTNDAPDEQKKREEAVRAKSNAEKKQKVAELRKENGLSGGKGTYKGKRPLGYYEGGRQPRTALPRAPRLNPPVIPRLPPGGIDFSSLELRYLSTNDQGGLDYAFRGRPAASAMDPAVGEQATGQATDALYTWLALPRESFLVNLNPTQPDNIVDAKLGLTDAGRVMLEADLQLKKTAGQMKNPNTPNGKRYLDELEALYGDKPWEACDVVRRLTIMPAPATVHETEDELYILDAPLTVDTGRMPDLGPATGYDCPQRDPATEARKDALWNELIMPGVINAVNTAPEYAELRRVYTSRIAAEWLRARAAKQRTPFNSIIDSGKIGPWVSETPWSAREVFNRFLDSYYNEKVTVPRQSGEQIYERIVPVGGVMFHQVNKKDVGEREFKTRYAQRAKQMRRAQGRLVKSGDEVWLGDSSIGSGAVPWVGVRARAPRGGYRAGGRVTYRVDVRNFTKRTVHDVRVCERVPSQLDYLRASRRAKVQLGQRCWTIPELAPGRRETITVRARAHSGARGRATHRVTATVSDSSLGTQTRQTVRVGGQRAGRAGGVTG
ncbi:MAG TPA: nucleic acid/nucleotide deaminase domain-containing protein [Solirubrobacter sp.]|nr:nucleic acid/nucleotide deaminase domain-containing protein [Solirubrobacter sp.]